MGYNDHKLTKEEEFRQWARNEIAQLNNALIVIFRVAKLDPKELAEALFAELENDVFSKNLGLKISEVRLQMKEKEEQLKKLSSEQPEQKDK